MASQLRWQLADADQPQAALFDEPVFEREPGRGEFRGLEFLHVRARTIINEVPAASRMPFRYTINAYRGCSHACSYCMSGDTPILMADGRTKGLAEVRPGDIVYGTVRVGEYRRYTPTPVLDHWESLQEAHRITLADGTQLLASADHRFLSDRGWKHVTGTECGARRRPHLTTNNSLLGVGGLPDPPKVDREYQRGYLCGMVRGDATIGSYEYQSGAAHLFRLALADEEAIHRTRDFLRAEGIDVYEFVFANASDQRREIRAVRTARRSHVEAIRHLIEWPLAPNASWTKGFLAGIFDAEGSSSRGVVRISNTNAVLIRMITLALEQLGFRYVLEGPNPRGVCYVRIVGGLRERLRLFVSTDPVITRKRTIDGVAIKSDADLRVVSIERLGFEMPMYDITTGTGDFVANGVVSHNCFARPTHAYLNLDIGRDFERKIVVKVNAVERLRHELDPRRWAGDHIAMGTNTDPYQRCEGKYHLTRGIVEVLTERRNPFSILTKGTLVLRDLDLLSEAAHHGDVRVNLSIGTLDEEVWRTTEPGTPHPLRRVEAVKRLNTAGIPTGVLVAPVLPGLSDRPEQLEAVAQACVDAGAVSVSTVLLHLRPGVKEHYLGSLANAHPELLPSYKRLYPRSYAPKAEQSRVAGHVARAVDRAGGVRSPSTFRFVAPPAKPSPIAEQQTLL